MELRPAAWRADADINVRSSRRRYARNDGTIPPSLRARDTEARPAHRSYVASWPASPVVRARPRTFGRADNSADARHVTCTREQLQPESPLLIDTIGFEIASFFRIDFLIRTIFLFGRFGEILKIGVFTGRSSG